MASGTNRVAAALLASGLLASWLGCAGAPGASNATDTAASTGTLVDVPRPDADTEHPTKGKTRYPEGGGCASQEDANRESERVLRRNEAAFHAAVRALGLRLVELPAASPSALEGAEDGPGAGEWAVQRAKGSKRILVGPSLAVDCGQPEPKFHFAADPSGKVYAVHVKQEQVGEEAISVCGCPTHGACGAPPRGMRFLYELPEGTTFAGIAEITHPMAWPSIEYAGTNGAPCPPLPPMP